MMNPLPEIPVTLDYVLLILPVMLLAAVLSSRVSDRLGVPALLMFMLVGMLAGSEGPGGIHFENYHVARFFGIIALSFIIFSGGLETRWESVRPLLARGVALSTLGVAVTALLLGAFAVFLLDFPPLSAFLLGAIVSSTDAASVFAVLRSRRVALKENIRRLLELESGSNDPMAVFLTTGLIAFIVGRSSLSAMVPAFFREMVFGAVLGYLMGRLTVFVLNRVRLEHEGMRPALTFSLVLITYGLASLSGANGFLAVYAAGIVVGSSRILHRKTTINFHDYLAWLMQIMMFLLLGLLVSPAALGAVLVPGLLLSLFLILAARPLSVFLLLAPARATTREKTLISWVGLRGAVPIILATFPFAADIPEAETIFNLVFFIVVTSLLLQGGLVPALSRRLKLARTLEKRKKYPLELEHVEGFDGSLVDIILPLDAAAAGKTLLELDMPEKSLVVLLSRQDKFFIPTGQTVVQPGDVLLVLASRGELARVREILLRPEDGKAAAAA